MLKYQSNQNIKKQIEQRQLLLARNQKLKTMNKTILKTTKLRQKRKLKVYKKDGKFYIDNSAAFALKLTNVRAIMTSNPHLIEVGMETLYKLQRNEDIEIEYQELNKDKETKMKQPNLSEVLDGLEQEEYGIGIHGIDKGTREEKQDIANSISNYGLNINNNSKTILSTSISFGINDDMQRISQEISRYQFGNGTKANVIIAVPLYIQNENGEKIFLGFPEQNKKTAGQQYEEHCILDRICSKLKKIPPQLILGYYCENPDGSESFIKNGQHYSNLTLKDREDFFTEVYSNMNDVSRNYNNLIANGNIEQLNQIREKMQQLGWNLFIVDNAISLAQKYKEQTKNSVRRKVILDKQPKNENLSDSIKSKRTRRILLDALAETKLSDINIAKETLKEGIEDQEKNYEGKEV